MQNRTLPFLSGFDRTLVMLEQTIKMVITCTCLLMLHFAVYGQEEKLEVGGAIQIADSEDPTPDAGTIRWSGSDFEGWDGTQWVSLTKGQNGNRGRVSDIEGNEYETITIGTQQWMSESLRTTKYNNGTPIPKVADGPAWSNLTSPAYCWFNNDSITHADPYGALYNHYTVADTNSLNICPTGWHIPSDDEWTTMATFLGGSAVAGGKMKEAGLAHWNTPNMGATNESGFSALPGGGRDTSGVFIKLSLNGFWWSSTESSSIDAWYHFLSSNHGQLVRFNFRKEDGLSLRCLRD